MYATWPVDLTKKEYSTAFILDGLGYESCFSGTFSVVSSHSKQSSCITLCKPIFDTGNDEINMSPGEYVRGHSHSHAGMHVTLLRNLSFLTTYRWHQHKTRLLLQMQKDMSRIESIFLECGKKWRDAAKVIPVKLSLLVSTLKGYEMEYTPSQFFYTVVLFGQWHPAAQTTFASHWNEQGLQRLRSSISSAARDIEKRFRMSVIPILSNFLLNCRELMGIEEAEHEVAEDKSVQAHSKIGVEEIVDRKAELNTLIRNSEWLMLKVDEALHECIFAGHNLLLFLQFLKENMLLAAADDSTDESLNNSQQNSPSDYLPLFDFRIPRAPEGVLGAKAQAECVTGTHLYAYFLDAPLPEDVVEYRKPFNGFYSNISAENLGGYERIETVKDILNLVEKDSGFDSESFARASLQSQFKLTYAALQNVLQHGLHVQTDDASSDPNAQHTDKDVHIIFNFRDTKFENVFAEDIIHVQNVPIRTEDGVPVIEDDGDNMSDTEHSDEEESEEEYKVVIQDGHFVVFALSSCVFLLMWRDEADTVTWYAAQIQIELPEDVAESAKFTFIKLYACNTEQSRPCRMSLVGCYSDVESNVAETDKENMTRHVLFKLDLLSICYKDVTDSVVDNHEKHSVDVIGDQITRHFDESQIVLPNLREVYFRGCLVDVEMCASRGLICLLLSDDPDSRDEARQLIILDMEEDEDDDVSKSCSEESLSEPQATDSDH